MTRQEKIWKCCSGDMLNRNPNEPIVSIVPSGKLTYLWIGNNAENDKFCFATISGPVRLRQLAKFILKQVGENGPDAKTAENRLREKLASI